MFPAGGHGDPASPIDDFSSGDSSSYGHSSSPTGTDESTNVGTPPTTVEAMEEDVPQLLLEKEEIHSISELYGRPESWSSYASSYVTAMTSFGDN